MEILGIGPLEVLFVILLALIVLGPKDMIKAGRTMGEWLRKLITSDTWRTVTQVSRRVKHLPSELMREAGLEEIQKTTAEAKSSLDEAKAAIKVDDKFDWTPQPGPVINTPREAPSFSAHTPKSPDEGHAG